MVVHRNRGLRQESWLDQLYLQEQMGIHLRATLSWPTVLRVQDNQNGIVSEKESTHKKMTDTS